MDLHEVCITELIYTAVLRTEGSNFGRINEAFARAVLVYFRSGTKWRREPV